MIKVYSTPTCPWCDKVKKYLSSQNLNFEMVDISQNRGAAIEMIKKTKQMVVPVTFINEKFVVGYDIDKIAMILEEEGLK